MEATKKQKPKRTLAPPPQPLAVEPWLPWIRFLHLSAVQQATVLNAECH